MRKVSMIGSRATIHLVSSETGDVLLEGTAVGKGLVGKKSERTARQLIALIQKAFGE